MIKRLILYTVIFIGGLYLLRELLYVGIRKNKSGIFEKYNSIFLKGNNHDVLFIGSSRVETHFDPHIFDSITGSNSFNIGITGGTPQLAFAVLKAYCSKSKMPAHLIFDVDFHFLKYGIDTVHHFPRYFPFLGNDVLFEEFQKIDKRFLSFKLNPMHSLPYSNLRILGASLHGWLGIPGKYDTLFYKGFQKTVFHDSLPTIPEKKYHSWINPVERQYMDSIILFARKNNIDLLLCTSPMYAGGTVELLNRDQIKKQIGDIALLNHLVYKDFSQMYFSDRRSCFSDYYHMTYTGSRLFSLEFSEWFLQYSREKSVN